MGAGAPRTGRYRCPRPRGRRRAGGGRGGRSRRRHRGTPRGSGSAASFVRERETSRGNDWRIASGGTCPVPRRPGSESRGTRPTTHGAPETTLPSTRRRRSARATSAQSNRSTCSRASATSCPRGVVGQNALEHAAERGGVARGEAQADRALDGHDLAEAAGVGDHAQAPGRHRLERHQPERLVDRRHDAQVARRGRASGACRRRSSRGTRRGGRDRVAGPVA